MKGNFRIGGALAVGALIVLGAFYVSDRLDSSTSSATVVAAKDSGRTAVPVTDSDGDGTQDWEETLQGKVFETVNLPTSTIALPEVEDYEPPTTFTGKFSEAFFQDYLEGKVRGADFSDPTAFINTAVEAIENNTQSKRHSQVELTIIPDSPEAIHDYGNEVAEMLKSHAKQNENEAVILQRALTANDPEMLKPLEEIRGVYEATIPDMLRIPVPTSLVGAHINLLNAFEAILTDVTAMQLAFTDPLYALARAKGYEGDSKQLLNGFKEVGAVLLRHNVTYANDEAGAFFMIFNTL